MKKILLTCSFILSIIRIFAQTYAPTFNDNFMKVKDKVASKAQFFGLKEVKLLNSPFKNAMEKDVAYLMELEPDRFLHNFREHAGLSSKGEIYGGWENMGVAGHSFGHYLSALAMGYVATGDNRLLEKLNYSVDELAICQEKRNGYIGAIPKEDSVFANIFQGKINSKGFDLNGLWVPWYTIHKLFAGLEDAYLYTGNKKALEIAVKFGDWAIYITQNLTEEDWQKMLACEHGGMNEVMANLYTLTGSEKYLTLSRKFHHKAILDPLSQQKDQLAGKHANTQIPKIIGCARRYEIAGDTSDYRIAAFFWERIVKHHSYVTGGNSDHEHLGEPDKLSNRLSDETTETCNTNNMLKLTRQLYSLNPDAGFMDYYERALYNHILASQNPENGMLCYFIPLKPGGQKKFSDKFNTFTCCVGTGIENHVKYGESIYAHGTDGSLFVNLFIPSELNWTEKGVVIRQENQYPEVSSTRLTFAVKNPIIFPVHIRFPKWAKSISVKINGNGEEVKGNPGGYITINRNWKNGDVVEIQLPMTLYSETMPDNKNRVAFLYGPLVLAGNLGEKNTESIYDAPVLVTNDRDVSKWLKPMANQKVTFESKGIGYPKDLTFVPFYKAYNYRYSVYFDYFTKEELKKRRVEFEAIQRRLIDIELRTVDNLRIGEMQPERDHNFKGENTFTGEHGGEKWRDARNGGWFSFDLLVEPNSENILVCKYWGSDNGREFDILTDGRLIASQKLNGSQPDAFFEIEYKIPTELTKIKEKINVRFQAHTGNTAGGLYGAKILRKSNK